MKQKIDKVVKEIQGQLLDFCTQFKTTHNKDRVLGQFVGMNAALSILAGAGIISSEEVMEFVPPEKKEYPFRIEHIPGEEPHICRMVPND